MKLSIIVPVYNTGKYLRTCLDSLVGQTLDDYEIILVNDGSTDDSQAIIDEYREKHDNISSILLDNGGQGRARNFALEMVRGDYIGFTDSDDWTDVTMFQKLYDAATQADADVAVCDYVRDGNGVQVYENAYIKDHPMAAAGAVWNKIFRRSVIGRLRFPEGLWYEDLAFSALILMKASGVVHVKEALYHYRSDNVSTMRNSNSAKNLDMIKIMQLIRQHMGGSPMEYYEYLLINNVLLDTINRITCQKTPDRNIVTAQIRDFIHREIPDLNKCLSYRNETTNRRIIMRLNYDGFNDLAKVMLDVKAGLRH